MGLYVHSLGEIPAGTERAHYVYLLDYGWEESLGNAVRANLPKMADLASRSRCDPAPARWDRPKPTTFAKCCSPGCGGDNESALPESNENAALVGILERSSFRKSGSDQHDCRRF
jgi:hypothetical protein